MFFCQIIEVLIYFGYTCIVVVNKEFCVLSLLFFNSKIVFILKGRHLLKRRSNYYGNIDLWFVPTEFEGFYLRIHGPVGSCWLVCELSKVVCKILFVFAFLYKANPLLFVTPAIPSALYCPPFLPACQKNHKKPKTLRIIGLGHPKTIALYEQNLCLDTDFLEPFVLPLAGLMVSALLIWPGLGEVLGLLVAFSGIIPRILPFLW